MALWRTGEEAMVRLANLQADVTRFEMAGRFTVAAALTKVAHTGYLFVYSSYTSFKSSQCY
jgi:propanediol dehydratase small subunit